MTHPLGAHEDARTEFKAAEVLRDPRQIARAVVAFLNAEGGTVWLGVRERDGVATELEAFPGAEAERARVTARDVITETIEPAADRFVKLDLVAAGCPPDRRLVRITVKHAPVGPYALRTGNQREYLARFEDRTRVLSHLELEQRFSQRASGEDEVGAARRRVVEHFKVATAGLMLVAAPSPARAVDVADPRRREALNDVLVDYHAAGNRRLGFTFHSPSRDARLKSRRLVSEQPGGDRVVLTKDGDFLFHAPLTRLLWKGSRGPDPARDIYPLALLELPTSAVRMVRSALMRQVLPDRPDEFVFRLGVLGARGWTLVPHSPQAWASDGAARYIGDTDAISLDVLASGDELEAAPDHVALLLVRQIYAAFALTYDQVPGEFDQSRGVLVLPE